MNGAVHSPQCSLNNAGRHSRAFMLHDSHRAERVGEFVPMSMKDEGKRSAGTVWISMRWALAYEYEVLRVCACEDYPCYTRRGVTYSG